MKLFVKPTLGFLMLLWSGLTARPAEHAGRPHDSIERAEKIDNERLSDKLDINTRILGRVREDYFWLNRLKLFRDDIDNGYNLFRSRIELGAHMEQGVKRYGAPATELRIKLCSATYWQGNEVYTPVAPVSTSLAGVDGMATGDAHAHNDVNPMIFLEEGYVDFHFHRFMQLVKDYPTSFKMGYFPFQLGRGLSLGYCEDMAITYAGWQGLGGYILFPSAPPGMLLSVELSKQFILEFYYNKWRANGYAVSNTFQPVNANRLNWPTIYRGRYKERDSWAVRGKFEHKHEKFGKIYAEPYFTYTRAPELPVEFDADSKGRLGTIGFMIDATHNQWNFNIECAGQFGSQEMFAYDRNQNIMHRDSATGNLQEVYSHVVTTDNPLTAGKVPVTAATQAIVNLPQNRAVDRNGARLVNAAGAAQPYYNSNFFGNNRFRPSYKLNYEGFLAMADVAYTMQDVPLKFAGAFGFIGGDQYPYNNESDHSYKTFVAQRALYEGHHVKSVLMLELLVIPRPTNIINRLLYAENNYTDYSNIQLIGANTTWYPLKDRKRMFVQPNVIWFWEVGQVKKWDNNGVAPAPEITNFLKGVGVTGWVSNQNASKFLGIEYNVILNYEIVKSCKFFFKGWVFQPGQLYRDLDGQPNFYGRLANPDGTKKWYGLGDLPSSGIDVGFDYKF